MTALSHSLTTEMADQLTKTLTNTMHEAVANNLNGHLEDSVPDETIDVISKGVPGGAPRAHRATGPTLRTGPFRTSTAGSLVPPCAALASR